jgi:hypothetical protein
MVEVFKTDVELQAHADMLANQLRSAFPGYKVNFDLEDCDKILRVVCPEEILDVSLIIRFLNSYGFTAQVLEDDQPSGHPALASMFSVN